MADEEFVHEGHAVLEVGVDEEPGTFEERPEHGPDRHLPGDDDQRVEDRDGRLPLLKM